MGDLKELDHNLSCMKPKDITLTYYTEQVVTPQTCMMHGQAEMAKWYSEHPNYKIMRWKCLNTEEQKKRIKA
jgi:hypothetical protein